MRVKTIAKTVASFVYMKFLNLLPVAIIVLLASCAPDTSEPVYPKATNLYFADFSGQQVGVMDVNTTNLYDVVASKESNGLDSASAIAIDFVAGKIYATEELNNRVVRFNIDGSGSLEVLFDESDGVKTPTAIALDPQTDTVYWANSGSGKLMKGARSGGTPKSLVFDGDSIISYSYGLAVDRTYNWILFSDLNKYKGIWYGKLDGTGSVYQLVGTNSTSGTVCRNPSAIVFDQQTSRLYWSDEGLGVVSVAALTIQFSQITNINSKVLYDDEDGIIRADGIAIDKGNSLIYWSETNADNHVIKRAALDGTGTPEVVLEDVESYSLVLKYDNQ